MAIGFSASLHPGSLNAMLGDTAIALRDAAFRAQKLWSEIASLGADQAAQVAGLQNLAGGGFTSGDAQAFWTSANYAYAVSQLYYGQITQGTVFNYDSALASARGGS